MVTRLDCGSVSASAFYHGSFDTEDLVLTEITELGPSARAF